MKYTIVFLLFSLISVSSTFSQEILNFDLAYKINPTQSSDQIPRAELNKAESVFDLDRFSKPSWVREYISVELNTIQNGEIKKHFLKNDILNQGEKDIINNADAGTESSFLIKYIPENNLKENEEKELIISFTIVPDKEAKYSEGEKSLEKYLNKNINNKIPNTLLKEYQLMAIKFTVNENGEIKNAHIFESSKDKIADKLVLDIINKMPNWKPAQYNNGTKTKQDFALTIGDHRSCVMNLLYLP